MDLVPGGYNGYRVSETTKYAHDYSCKSDMQKEKEAIELEEKNALKKSQEIKQKLRNFR